MKKNIIVKQTGFKDCAVASLLSIIRYYNGNISKEELSLVINTNENGSSAYHMIEGMKKLGFDGYGFRKSSDELFEEEIICPFIAHVKNQNYYHFIVVYNIDKKRNSLLIMDPAKGKYRMKKEEFDIIYLNSILEFFPIKELPNISQKDKLFTLILEYIKLNRKKVIKLFIFGIISIFLTLISSLYYKLIIDVYLKNSNNKLLITTFIIFLNIILMKNIIFYVRDNILIKLRFEINRSLTINILKHILNLPYCYFKNKPTGEVISRINNIDDLNNLISNIILTLLVNVILIIVSMFVLIFLNIKLFAIVISTMLIYSLIVIVNSLIFKKDIYSLKETNDLYNKNLTEIIENYETIKNLNLIKDMLNKLNIYYLKFLGNFRKCEYKFRKQELYKNLLLDVLNLFILTIGGYFIILKQISLGNLLLFISILYFFIDPIKEILSLVLNYNYGISSYERINDITLIKEEQLNNEDNSLIEGDIVIRNLSYSFDKVNILFKQKNINIKYYDKFLIHGVSGKGKSTIIKILLKYYEEYGGNVYINNINIKDMKTETIRNSFTFVSQNEYLFSSTLKENILLNRSISDDEYEKVLKICKVDEIRDKKMFRDNFLIEDKGFNLSGGERQRIILARALLKRFNYLILDECLSEVDVELEKEIICNIFKHFENKTIIYITHKEEIKKLFNKSYQC